jgi:hypothetical protein
MFNNIFPFLSSKKRRVTKKRRATKKRRVTKKRTQRVRKMKGG